MIGHFRVERIGATINYSKNGETFYVSTVPSSGNLIADATLYNYGAVVNNAVIYGTSDTTAPTISSVTTTVLSNSVLIHWATDELAKSQVNYGVASVAENSSALTSVWSRTHEALLSNLAPNTNYQYQIYVKDAAGNGRLESQVGFTTNSNAEATIWTDLVGVAATNNNLSKTGASGWNAGAASTNYISGDGALEFTARVGDNVMAGLSNSNASASYDTIGYALYLYNSVLKVYENGADRGQFIGYQTGDVLRVERIGTIVNYRKNGEIFYTSTVPSSGNLIADTTLHNIGAVINNVVWYGAVQHLAAQTFKSKPDNNREVARLQAWLQSPDKDLVANVNPYRTVANTGANAISSMLVTPNAAKSERATGLKVWIKNAFTDQRWIPAGSDPRAYPKPDKLIWIAEGRVHVWQWQAEEEGYRHHAFSMTDAGDIRQADTALERGAFIPVANSVNASARVGSETWSYTYDGTGNLSFIATGEGAVIYDYDALNRVVEEGDLYGARRHLSYDRNGNRAQVDRAGQVETLVTQFNSNRLASDGDGVITHDAAGNRTSDKGGARSYSYDESGRLYQIHDAGSLLVTYYYNALGQRTRKVTATGTTLYHYDLSGQLIAETSDTGAPLRDYVNHGNQPVAQIDVGQVDESLAYIHSDHLGTPRRATDVNGVVVWSWNSDAFGQTPTEEDPDNDGISTTINLRFPGQYYDAETALHYNYYRYYDPAVGRYITSDPIGLHGGLNTYAYVGVNPLNGVDPFGKNTYVIRGAWYAGFNILGKRFAAPAIDVTLGYLTGTASLGALIYNLTHDETYLWLNEKIDEGSTEPESCPNPDKVEEEYDSLEAAVGSVNPLDEVELEGKTKDPGLRGQGFTEKWTGIDSDGTYQSAFKNPRTKKWTGGHRSSKNDKFW